MTEKVDCLRNSNAKKEDGAALWEQLDDRAVKHKGHPMSVPPYPCIASPRHGVRHTFGCRNENPAENRLYRSCVHDVAEILGMSSKAIGKSCAGYHLSSKS